MQKDKTFTLWRDLPEYLTSQFQTAPMKQSEVLYVIFGPELCNIFQK